MILGEQHHAPAKKSGFSSRHRRAVRFPPQNNPLYSRAWALQERILSQRVLIFGSDQLYWDCRTVQDGQDGEEARRLLSSRINAAEMTPHDWHIIVEEYTGRMLTEESDKLPALGGLAAIYRFATQDQYLFGLWRGSLATGLLWFQRQLWYGHRAPRGVPKQYRAPS